MSKSIWFWVEFVCRKCAETSEGCHIRMVFGRKTIDAANIERLWRIAQKDGWTWKAGETYCRKCSNE